MTKRTMQAGALALSVAVLAGCGGHHGVGTGTSAAQVISAMGKHGAPCTVPHKPQYGGSNELDCTYKGDTLRVVYWPSNQARDATLTDDEKQYDDRPDGTMVLGDRWSITANDKAEAAQIQKAVGGTVR